MNSKNANKVLERIAKEFSESDTIPQYIAEVMIKCPEIPCAKWSQNNQILMQFGETGYTSDARGYNQWKAVGRHVKRGAKARYILGPTLVKDKNNEDKKILVGFKTIPVFAVQDTEGKELEQYEPKVIPPLMELAKVQYKDTEDGEGGYYLQEEDTITLCTEAPRTFFHELVHKYDAKSHKLVNRQDPIQEIVAELGSAVLCRLYDVHEDNPNNHMAYIANYASAKTPAEVGEVCLKVADRVMTAITKILTDAETLN